MLLICAGIFGIVVLQNGDEFYLPKTSLVSARQSVNVCQ